MRPPGGPGKAGPGFRRIHTTGRTSRTTASGECGVASRGTIPAGAKIHASVHERMDRGTNGYRPENLPAKYETVK